MLGAIAGDIIGSVHEGHGAGGASGLFGIHRL